VDLSLHVLAAEGQLGIEAVVRSADDPQVARVMGPAAGTWHDVIELEVVRRRASIAFVIRERASLAVPREHLTPDCAWNLISDTLFLELGEETVERLIDDSLEVVAPNAMAEEVARPLELRANRVCHGELEAIPRRRQRLDPGSRHGWRR
jgi:hypothetical protein